MPSARRIKPILLIILIATFMIVYLTTAKRSTRSSPFYTKTQAQLQKAHYENDVTNAMANAGDADAAKKRQDRSPTGDDRINDARAQRDAGSGRLEDTLKERLRLAEVAAKKSADEKWKGVKDAAKNAIQGSGEKPGESNAGDSKTGEQAVAPNSDVKEEVAAKREVNDESLKAADTVEKIIEEVKRSVEEEVLREHEGMVPVAPKEVEKSKEKVESLISKVSPNDKETAEELRRQIREARDREKAKLKAEYRKQLIKQEMERQRAAGNKLKAVDPVFEERQRQQKSAHNAAKDKNGNVLQKPKAAPTSKAPPIPTTPTEVEFHKLLALSPITIFSKSYCPYSLKAKRILLQAFDITPSPYVVELDKHALGQELQAMLFEKTQRRTVPNVIVAGKSIGGGDDIEKLWENGKLRQTIKDLAGRRVVGVVENEDILKRGWRQ